ncbi:H-NS histone family protein [Bradyrhizobium stylosanthis]|nr:H-NS histone family protein [Bradyrhizobium stylosanthis]
MNSPGPPPERRPYPTVRPRYRNPKNPPETWSGRGKCPDGSTRKFVPAES